MREFQLGRYIKKWMPLIVIFFVVMTLFAYQTIAKMQTYVASTVIEYTNEGAIRGNAPDGSQINTAEIYSSSNMASTMNQLGITLDEYGLDRLCKSITVTPVVDEQSSLIQESVNKEGIEYTNKPTTFIVSCMLDYTGSKSKAQMILNQLLDEYYSDYSIKHINASVLANQTADILNTDYDYLEMIELIESQLNDTISDLDVKYNRDRYFRSSRTGYSYAELRDQFQLLKQIDIADLYAMVLGNQITKDRALLINKYNNRISQYDLQSQYYREQIKDALEIIDSYVEKMRSSGNTDIDYNYILSEVVDNTTYDSETGTRTPTAERTVQYDKLLRHWLSDKNSADDAVVKTAYCQYVINAFQKGATGLASGAAEVDPVDQLFPAYSTRITGKQTSIGEDGTINVSVDRVVTAGHLNTCADYIAPVSREKLNVASASEADAVAALRSLLQKMQLLYAVTDQTTVEYNEYLGAQNIQTLSSTSSHDGMNVKLYTVLIAFFFLVVGCCGAILLGRAEDILEYVIYRDHETGLMNRVACDNYIKAESKKVQSANRSCLSVRITNRRELNEKLGREKTDRLIAESANVLKTCYHNQQDSFICNNGGGQFIVFFDLIVGDSVMEQNRIQSTLHQLVTSSEVEYMIGIASAGEEQVYTIRELLSCAIAKQKVYKA